MAENARAAELSGRLRTGSGLLRAGERAETAGDGLYGLRTVPS